MDCTDKHFRMIIRKISSKALLYTEMIVAQSLIYTDNKERFLDFNQEEHPGLIKKDCVVLDFGTSVLTHGSLDEGVDLDGAQANTGGATPLKNCPECQSEIPLSSRESLDGSSKRRSSLGSLERSRDNVRVVCRVRPQNSIEKSRGGKVCVSCNENRITVDNNGRNSKFNFDALFSPETKNDQADVFEACGKPMVEQLFRGFNATIFAFAASNSFCIASDSILPTSFVRNNSVFKL